MPLGVTGIALDHADRPELDIDDEAIAAVCDRYGIAELRIFGSHAHGTAAPGRDIDV